MSDDTPSTTIELHLHTEFGVLMRDPISGALAGVTTECGTDALFANSIAQTTGGDVHGRACSQWLPLESGVELPPVPEGASRFEFGVRSGDDVTTDLSWKRADAEEMAAMTFAEPTVRIAGPWTAVDVEQMIGA